MLTHTPGQPFSGSECVDVRRCSLLDMPARDGDSNPGRGISVSRCFIERMEITSSIQSVFLFVCFSSVLDPKDSYVFGPPGFVIICTDPDLDLDPSINKEIFFSKNFISTLLWLLNYLFSLRTDVNPVVRKLQKKNLFFVGFLKACDEKSRIRICYIVYEFKDPDPYQNLILDPEHWLFSSFINK
jgi:hypothetical protein